MNLAKALLGITAVLTGCGGVEPSGGAGTDIIFRTVVVLHKDGAPDVRHVEVTREQSRAEYQERLQRLTGARAQERAAMHPGVGQLNQGLSQDTGCAFASVWLSDGSLGNGSYQICFSGAGDTHLADWIQHFNFFPQAPTTWRNHVGSFAPGTEDGFFASDDSEFPSCTDTIDSASPFWRNISCASNQYFKLVLQN